MRCSWQKWVRSVCCGVLRCDVARGRPHLTRTHSVMFGFIGKWKDLAAWLRQALGLAPLADDAEQAHVLEYEALKEQVLIFNSNKQYI
jgi:hypothetical protein